MIKHIVDDLYQVGESVENEHGVEAVLTYVMLNEGAPILIDCGSHIHRETVMAEIQKLVGDTVPEYILLTHSELPHAGNIASVAQLWPSIKVIVSNVMLPYIEVLPVLPLQQLSQVNPGTKIELPTRTIEFVDALLKDQPGSQWIYDSRTEALFTGDGFGYFCPPADVWKFSDELDEGIAIEQFQQYHQIAFRFLRWIEPARLNADLDLMFNKRTISVVAPIHGTAIRSDVQTHLGRVKEALAAANREYYV